MSTRSEIAILNNDGTVTAIYCHWDGYVENNGIILSEHYKEIEKVKELIKNGDLSSLNKNIEPNKDSEHSFERPQKDVCVYYHRDRGEEWDYTKPKTYQNILEMYKDSKNIWAEYLYIYIVNEWYYAETRNKKLYLKHLDTEVEEIKNK